MRRTKTRSPIFSFRYMENKVSIDASHLVKIFQKQRHIGKNSIEKFINFCDLTGTDAEYFAALVHFNKAKSDRTASFIMKNYLPYEG